MTDRPMPTPTLTNRPSLSIALGDPAGIGSEVVLKALADAEVVGDCNLTLVGNWRLLQSQLSDDPTTLPEGPPHFSNGAVNWLEVPLEEAIQNQIQIGVENAASGEAGFRFLEAAIAHTTAGNAQAVVTAPISKSAWQAAGHDYPGQTELLAERAGVDRYGMLFVARSPHTGWTLRALLATTHISLRQVPDTLTPDLLTRKLDLLIDCLHQDFGVATPRIAVAGLNPHSGEQGHLGQEEVAWMNDWLRQMRDRHPQTHLDGLIPPDTLWVRPGQAWFGTVPQAQAHDAYLALYHDQGLIPVKLMAFDRAVNTTIGLPFIRTSPDHGTAFDIAGKGIADPQSMKMAIQLAAELAAYKFFKINKA